MANLFKAISLMNRNLYDAAIKEFRDVLTAEPENPVAHAQLALCLLHNKKLFSALEEAKRALAANPELPLAHLAMSLILTSLDDPKGAEDALKEVLRIDPENTDALEIRCVIAMRQRNPKDLKQSADMLLSSQPNALNTHVFLSRAAEMSGDGVNAEKHARTALEIQANDKSGHEAIGWAFLKQKKFQEAKDAALSAMYLAPESASAHALIAAIEMQRNRLTGWFHRMGYKINTLSIEATFKWLAPLMIVYLVWLDVLRYFERSDIPELSALFDNLGDMTRYLFLMVMALLWLSASRFSRKATEYQKTAKLRTDY